MSLYNETLTKLGENETVSEENIQQMFLKYPRELGELNSSAYIDVGRQCRESPLIQKIENSTQYCRDYGPVGPSFMGLFTSQGQVFCAKYTNYIRYVDALRPVYDPIEEEFKCLDKEMVLCPGMNPEQKMQNPFLGNNAFCVLDAADCPITEIRIVEIG